LFLVSTHYTHYDITYFTVNFLATVAVVVPKLPAVSLPRSSFVVHKLLISNQLHRMRFAFFNYEPEPVS